MFKNLRTSTKLVLLCAMFIISVGVTTYSLVTEKEIAVSFARKELIGSKFLATLRGIDVAVLRAKPLDPLASNSDTSVQRSHEALAVAQTDAGSALGTEELTQALSNTLRLLEQNSSPSDSNAADVLAKVQRLAVRIGDNSNLTLDTDIDAYYTQNILVDQLPRLLGYIGDLQRVMSETAGVPAFSNENKAHILVLDGLIGSSAEEIKDDLIAAYRGNPDGSLKHAVDSTYALLFSATDAYLSGSKALVGDADGAGAGSDVLERRYEAVVDSANTAWAKSESHND